MRFSDIVKDSGAVYRRINSVPAFALRELCGRIGPPILEGPPFSRQLGLVSVELQHFLVINYN